MIWTETKRKVSSILLAKAVELRRQRSFAQAEINAVADARKAQMAAIPGATGPVAIDALNRKVVDKRRTFSPVPTLAENIIRAEETRKWKWLLSNFLEASHLDTPTEISRRCTPG